MDKRSNAKTEVIQIVRRYGEAKGAAEHHIDRGLNAAGNALRAGVPPTGAAVVGMNKIDLGAEMTREANE